MDNLNGWLKWIIAAFFGGSALGYLTTKLLKMILVGEQWNLLTGFVTPLFIVLSLLFVLYLYQRDKDNTIN